jgi:HEPN domain-containing protein
MVKREAVQYAKGQMENADMTLSEVKDRMNQESKFDIGIALQNINTIQDCQRFIEIYVKSMFKLVGVNPLEQHKIDFGESRTEGFLKSEFPDNFESEDDLPRVVFLTHFWKEFYEEAKYGYPEKNIQPSDLFTIDDAKRAIAHAEFVQKVGQELLETVQEEQTDE